MINLHAPPISFLSIVIDTIATKKVQLIHNDIIFIIIANFIFDINSDSGNSK